MTAESTTSVPSQRRSVMLDIGDGNRKYANANSYLKARRSAAIEERRSKILDRVDSSIDDVKYELPDISKVNGPIVPLPQPAVKRKSRSLPLKTSSSSSSPFPTRSTIPKKTASFSNPRPCHPPTAQVDVDIVDDKNVKDTDDVTSPMEEVLKTLESSGAGESDGTSCTHMMSSTSFAFNMSQCSVLTKEFLDCEQGEYNDDNYDDEDDATYETEYEIEEESYRDDDEGEFTEDAFYSADEWSVEFETDNEGDEEEEILEESIHDDDSFEEILVEEDDNNQEEYDVFEEAYFSDEEIVEEILEEFEEGEYEEHSIEDDEHSYEELIVDEEIIGDSYDEFVIEEEIIGDSDDGEFEEYVIEEEYRSKCSESSLGIIDEEDYDSDSSDECSTKQRTNLDAKSHHAAHTNLDSKSKHDTHHSNELYYGEEYEEIQEEDEASYRPYVTECYDEYEESLYSFSEQEDEGDDCDVMDDESYIEEEIIPEFEVPVIPAIEAWHKQQEELMAIDEELPEVAPRTPREILMAVLAAAAMDFKLRKVPEDHKRRYTPLSASAACLGRLTKLDEFAIEAYGRAPARRNDEDWCPTGAPIVFHQSLSLRIATEAAAMGRVMRLKERIVTNYEEPKRTFFSDYGEEKVNVDGLLDEKGRPVFRTSVLVPFHERLARQKVMSKDWKVGILEASCELSEGITVDTVNLPTTRVPRFKKPMGCSPVMSRDEIKDAIARGVAEGAWDRRYRLDRPQVQLRITSVCRCRYCENPNAFQTHAYKKLRKGMSLP